MQYVINQVRSFNSLKSLTSKELKSSELFEEINILLENSETTLRNTLGIKLEEICSLLNNLRELAPYSSAQLKASSLNFLLKELVYPLSVPCAPISQFIYALGSLAPQISGKLDTRTLSDLLYTVSNQELSPVQTGNILHGLGKLASNNMLDSYLDSTLINSIFAHFIDTRMTSTQISQAYYALGTLARCGHLNQLQNSLTLDSMLDIFPATEPSYHEVAVFFYGLRSLCRCGLLSYPIKPAPLAQLLNIISTPPQRFFHDQVVTRRYIDSYLLTLESLAELSGSKKLTSDLDSAQIRKNVALITDFMKKTPDFYNDRNVALLFHSISILSSDRRMDSEIDTHCLIFDLQSLLLEQKIEYSANSISLILFAIGHFTEHHLLFRGIDPAILQRLLKTFVSLNPSNSEIAQVISSLGRIAAGNPMLVNINNEINLLFKHLITSDADIEIKDLCRICRGIQMLSDSQNVHPLPSPATIEVILARCDLEYASHTDLIEFETIRAELEFIGLIDTDRAQLTPPPGLYSAPLSFSSIFSRSGDSTSPSMLSDSACTSPVSPAFWNKR